MPTLYVTEPGVQVRKANERLVVVKDDQVLDDIPLIKVDRVVLVGRGVGLTTAAVHALSRRGIDVLYLSGSGRYVSSMVGTEHKNIRLRFTQALLAADEARSLAAAGAIVQGKVANQRALVRRHSEGSPSVQTALDGMETMRRQVERARTLDELRGMEGQAAHYYFGLLRALLRPPDGGGSWGFDQRSYYPPPDPINALLSFGYTLLLNDLVAAC
jgi:CRISPR-associated protein Cas1